MESCTRSRLTMFGCTAVSKPCEEERTRRFKQAHGDALCFVKRRRARRQAVMMANSRSAGGKAATKKLSMRTVHLSWPKIFDRIQHLRTQHLRAQHLYMQEALIPYSSTHVSGLSMNMPPQVKISCCSCWELLVCTGF